MEYYLPTIGFFAYAVETLGVIVILGGVFHALRIVMRHRRALSQADLFTEFRREFARIMLVGLDHTLTDISSLGLLVLIRTVLVFTMHLELHGHWPWQRGAEQVD
jgi:uncharacterized membrane protein